MYNPYYHYYPAQAGCQASFSTFSLDYWERSLFQRLQAMFTIKGLPEGGPGQVQTYEDPFWFGLCRLGYLIMFETKQYGITFQPGSLTGIGLQYQPTGAIVNTPYFQFSRPLKIGEECAIIKLTPDYMGVWDIITKYAGELQRQDIAIRLSQLNARFAYAIAARNQQEAASVKALMEKITNGEPAVVYNAKLKQSLANGEETAPWEQMDRDLKKNFILPELISDRQRLIQDFYREIGLRTQPDKRERLVAHESEAYDDEALNRREVFDRSLQSSLKIANKMFGTNITARFTLGGDDDVFYDTPEQQYIQREVDQSTPNRATEMG